MFLSQIEPKKITVYVREQVPVTGITLDKNSITFSVAGQTEQLTATITPNDADDQAVTWSSNNTSIATVSSTGLVTCVTPGTATITATTHDGGYTATCNIYGSGQGWQPDASRTLLYLKFNNNLTDDSGNNNSVSGTGIQYGTIGNNHYVELTSTSGDITPPHLLGQNIEDGDYTVSFFFNSPDNAQTGEAPWYFGNRYDTGYPRPGINIRYGYNNSSNYITFGEDGSGGNSIDYSFTANTWYHYALTRVNGVMYMYINGNLIGQFNNTFNMKTPQGVNKFVILNRSDYSPQSWQATGNKMSEVIFEKVGWSAGDVSNYVAQNGANYGIGVQTYNADFTSSTGWSIAVSGNIDIQNGEAAITSGWGGIYQDISNDLDFSNASKIEMGFDIWSYQKPRTNGCQVIIGDGGLSGAGNPSGTTYSGCNIPCGTASSYGPAAVMFLAGTDVNNSSIMWSDFTDQSYDTVKGILDLSNGTYEYYLNSTLFASGTIPPTAITDFFNNNNQYLCIRLSDYCKIKDLYIKVS